MPRPNSGPRLVVKKPRGYSRKLYFVVWYENGQRHERATSTNRLEEAQRTLSKVLQEITLTKCDEERPNLSNSVLDQAQPASLQKIIQVGDILAEYVAGARNRAAIGVLRAPGRIAAAVQNLMPYWHTKSIHDISSDSFAEYAAMRMKCDRDSKLQSSMKTISLNTVRRELSVLRSAVFHALDRSRITNAPRMRLPGKPGIRSDNYYSRAEVAAILRSARKNCRLTAQLVCLFILIAIYTGQRAEAILELRWTIGRDGGWVDLDRERINFLADGASQSDKRRAHLVIPPRLLRFLRYAYAKSKSNYVFEFRGERISCNKKAFSIALQNSGFDVRGRSRHTLRDTCITWLLDAGVSPWHIGQFVELSVEMVLGVYGKKTPGGRERAAMREKLQIDNWINKISAF
jgi:integrase